MLNDVAFLVRMTAQDRVMLAELATHLQRTKADALRILVREKWANLKEQGVKGIEKNQTNNRPVN